LIYYDDLIRVLREIREPIEDTYNDSSNWKDLKHVLKKIDATLDEAAT
jgi:hypothetical protein